MKTIFVMFAVAAAVVFPLHAQEVYVCIDENGVKEYKNTGITTGCKKVDLPDVTTFEAPQKRAPAPVTAAKAATPTPPDFPRIDSGTQKARDSERRQILSDELKSEEQKLAELKKEYNNGEPERRGDERNYAKYQDRVASLKEGVGRSEKNIEALRRELDKLR
jgi:hypothetical protein